jgi:predicted 3-demethylubiquinone-9 3-methyltransferase (glyoxalase superfamily)
VQKITPFLWFDTNAEEAVNLYVSVFKSSKILNLTRYGEGGPGPAGSVAVVAFELEGQEFAAINGGPAHNFTEAVSFYVKCETQEEIDHFWERLSAGGEPGQCGWLKDRFGLSWQIVPPILVEMLQDRDADKAQRVMLAMLQMTKIDIKKLRQAYEQT